MCYGRQMIRKKKRTNIWFEEKAAAVEVDDQAATVDTFWKRITQSRGGRERIGNILVIVVVIKIVAVVVVVVIAIEDILFRFRYFFLLKMPLKIVEEKVSDRFEPDQHQNGDSEEASDTSNHSESESFSEKSSVIRSII